MYAQVNRDKKKSSRDQAHLMAAGAGAYGHIGANGGAGMGEYAEHADHWRVMQVWSITQPFSVGFKKE